jgi:hypothetical protein
MGKRRLDAPDTVDVATHMLHRLQAEGWAVEELEWNVEYQTLEDKGARIPVGAEVTVRLVPRF